jgi:hypothetical protein
MNSQYKLELPGDSVELIAPSDEAAAVQAKAYLKEHRITMRGLKLFRYPNDELWLSGRSKGMIEVPFYQLS